MSTCQVLSGRSNAAHTTSAGSRLSARKVALRRAGASSAVSRAMKLAPLEIELVLGLFRALVTAVYARGASQLPQELSTGYRQAYRPVAPAVIRDLFPEPSTGITWIATRSPAPN